MTPKKIIVLGGGTAGWLTALMVKTFYPKYHITLLESDEIGILGAGEGTTPHILNVLGYLKISIPELVKHCKATLKLGINFINWNGDNESYFHPFAVNREVNPEAYSGKYKNSLLIKRGAKNQKLDDLFLGKLLSRYKKVPFTVKPKNSSENNAKDSIKQHGSVALHFDARLLANYLKDKAIARGIERVEGKVNQINGDEEGNIVSLDLTNGKSLALDFIFDCSGFARLIIGKHFQSEWVSYKDFLPLDTALPFFLPHDNDVAAETQAIAMKYGWVWKIPVQDRFGCGYVFDSSYISESEAKQELEDMFGQKIESPKTFKFEAGCYRDTFIKNSFAVGLSQGFIEPLEATSIWINNINLIEFLELDGINTKLESKRKLINENAYMRNEKVANFIHFHYLTQRKDSDFWKNFRTKNKVPQKLLDQLDIIFESPLNYPSFNDIWPYISYLAVGAGINYLKHDSFQEMMDRFDLKFDDSWKKLALKQSEISKKCVTHKQYIDVLKSL